MHEFARLALDRSPDPAFWILPGARFFYVNDAACASLEYSREELLQMTVADIDLDFPLDQWEVNWKEMKERGSVIFQGHQRTKSGRIFPVEVHSNFLTLGDREFTCAFSRDISERIESERDLERSRVFLNAAGRMAKVGGWELDANSKEVRWTEETFPIHELPPDSAPPLEDALSFYDPDDRTKLEAAIAAALEKGEPYDMEIRFVTAKKRKLWVHTICQPEVVDGKVARLMGTFQDITERKQEEEVRSRLEAELRQAQKMEAVGQLAGGVAHDFNNLLTSILGNSEILMPMLNSISDASTQSAAINSLKQIRRAGHNAAALTRQLMAFGRKEIARMEVLDLHKALNEMLQMLQRLIRENITFEVDLEEKVQPIRADAVQLEQVILNLVLNAQDAMPEGGELQLSCRNVELDRKGLKTHMEARPGPHVMVAIKDTGQGMSKDTVEHIFEPFFTTKPIGQGTGLGLATVYGIVRRSGGHIEVSSQPGKGSEFCVYFPAVEESQDDTVVELETKPTQGTETVLVCEDEEMVRDVACQILRSGGYKVMEASNGQDALRIAKEGEEPIHLLVTDVVMPQMNGRDLAAAISGEQPDLKVVFVSGYTAEYLDGQVSERDGYDFLQKPFNRTSLLQAVRQLLDS
ncbi:MAG: hybrid sensor histidine kinase/response regulator [Planctomycetota bacterium]